MSTQEDSRQKQLKKWQKILPEEWVQNQLAASTPDINKEIVKCAVATIQLAVAKELDRDLASLKDRLKIANEQYKEGTKVNNTKIEYLVDCLKCRGEDVPDPEVFLRKAANGEYSGLGSD